jgi:hypothetical protein
MEDGNRCYSVFGSERNFSLAQAFTPVVGMQLPLFFPISLFRGELVESGSPLKGLIEKEETLVVFQPQA